MTTGYAEKRYLSCYNARWSNDSALAAPSGAATVSREGEAGAELLCLQPAVRSGFDARDPFLLLHGAPSKPLRKITSSAVHISLARSRIRRTGSGQAAADHHSSPASWHQAADRAVEVAGSSGHACAGPPSCVFQRRSQLPPDRAAASEASATPGEQEKRSDASAGSSGTLAPSGRVEVVVLAVRLGRPVRALCLDRGRCHRSAAGLLDFDRNPVRACVGIVARR